MTTTLRPSRSAVALRRRGANRTARHDIRAAVTNRPGLIRRWWIGLPEADKGILTAAAFVGTTMSAVLAFLVLRSA